MKGVVISENRALIPRTNGRHSNHYTTMVVIHLHSSQSRLGTTVIPSKAYYNVSWWTFFRFGMAPLFQKIIMGWHSETKQQNVLNCEFETQQGW